MNKRFLSLLVTSLYASSFICQSIVGQVTIGSGKAPETYSILEIISNSDSPGGLRIPQVRNAIERLAIEKQFNGNSNAKGLIIYNIETEYLEYWDGVQWVTIQKLLGVNGVTFNGKSFELGGNLNKATTIQMSTNNLNFTTTTGNIGIGTTTPTATLDVNGTMRIGNVPAIANASVLVRDDTTGKIGTAVAVPTKVAFIQSTEEQRIESEEDKTNLNNSIPVQVTWSQNDIVSNNVVSFNDAKDVFQITQSGLYELSGFLNYSAYATIPPTYPITIETGRAGVNVSIQISTNGGQNWTDFTAARSVFTGTAVNTTAQTIIIPPGVLLFNAGTQIRMIFQRPANFGLPHGATGSCGIALPTGIRFSKGMKIIAL